ncbi:MAG: response regulator [Candidatus Omnitrophota bacterium]
MPKKIPKKILIIDDDPNMIETLTKWLIVSGRNVISALNADAGLKMAHEELPDLILSDLLMPGIDGVQLTKKLKECNATKDIPIIFTTVAMGVEMDKGNETINIDGCLYRVFAKPLHDPKLLSEIRKSINRRIHGGKSIAPGS